MALDKPSLNDFLPNGFETQNKTDYKAGFSADKIAVGFEKDTLEVLSGPNLNDLLDKTGKNTHVLSDFLNYFKNMPIGSFPVVNTSNQLDYKSVNSFFRNVGELVYSLIPLEDENLRLLDGSLLENEIKTSRFISYIAGLRSTLPNLFTTEANWQAQVQQYGVCGKFVYNTTDKSLRLPKITGFVQGTNDSNSLGDLVEASIPQHTHNGTTESGGGIHDHGRGTMDITGSTTKTGLGLGSSRATFSGAFSGSTSGNGDAVQGGWDNDEGYFNGQLNFKASNSWTGRTTSENIEHTHDFTTDIANNNVYKSGATTVQPQAIKAFIYIVVSIDEAEKQVLSAVYNYKGSVPTYADLPNDAAIGEVYNVIGEDPEGYSGANFAWTGEEWDRLGGTVNLSGYLTKVEGANTYATKASLESNVDYLQGQINTNASNIANIASQEVIEQGIKKIEALKFSSTIGNGITNDVDLYAVIKKYAHSSFDRSKFTVVGSPVITDDGIAIFNSSSRLKTGYTLNPSKGQSWKIKMQWEVTAEAISGAGTADNVANRILGYGNTTNCISLENNTRFYWLRQYLPVYDFVAETNKIFYIDFRAESNNKYNPSVGDIVDYEVWYNTTDLFKARYRINNGAWIDGVANIDKGYAPLTMSNYTLVGINPLGLGNWYDTGATYDKNRQNLKYFEVEVDDKVVFSGNKTGIDTIKPDNYTVVGTPTISDDGVALTGYGRTDNSNKFSSNTFNMLSNNQVFEGIVYIESVPSDYEYPSQGQSVLTYVQGNSYIRIYRFSMVGTNYVQLEQQVNGTWVGNSYNTRWTLGANFNGWVKFKLYYDTIDNCYKCDCYTYDNGIATFVKTMTCSYTGDAITGSGWSIDFVYGQYQNYGKIDLNSIRVFDNSLVYQPCLKIPYTLSNTDLKITRNMDRAIDMANQCGFSDYFGLDESNNTCMVPQGDNISGRRTLVSRTEDSVTHYVTEIYSDLFCRQSGSGTANTALTFAIPYKNDDTVKVSCPYSAKSKTGFTPTANCDWFAEGYIYLDEVI